MSQPQMDLDLEELSPGDVFRVANQPRDDPFEGLYEYLGHGWYWRAFSANALCSPGRQRREVIRATTAERMAYNHKILSLREEEEKKKSTP